jgi:hypothetical protein
MHREIVLQKQGFLRKHGTARVGNADIDIRELWASINLYQGLGELGFEDMHEIFSIHCDGLKGFAHHLTSNYMLLFQELRLSGDRRHWRNQPILGRRGNPEKRSHSSAIRTIKSRGPGPPERWGFTRLSPSRGSEILGTREHRINSPIELPGMADAICQCI